MNIVHNSNIIVVLFLVLYLVFINYLFKRLHNNHFGLKALVIFIFSTLIGQIGKTLPNHSVLTYYLMTYSLITIDIGTIFLFLKEYKKSFSEEGVVRLYIELVAISLVVLLVSLFTKNTGYIRLHTSLMAFSAIVLILFRLFKLNNISYDLSFILSYIGYGIFCLLLGLYELFFLQSSLYYYIFLGMGFIFHIIGLTRKYTDAT